MTPAAPLAPAREAVPALHQRLRRWLTGHALGRAFWRFLSVSLLFNLGFSSFFFLFNLSLLDFGFTEGSIGAIAGAMSVGSIAGTLPMGMLAQRLGIRRVLFAAILPLTIVSALRAFLHAYSSQLLLAFLAGLLLCSWAVCLSPAIAQLTQQRNRPFAFSLVFSSAIGICGLGNLLGGSLPAWLLALSAHHLLPTLTPAAARQLTLLAACGVGALSLLPLSRLVLLQANVDRQPLLRRPPPFLLRFLPAMALWTLATGAFTPFASIFFARHLGVTVQHIGGIFSISQVIQVIAIALAPLLYRRTGRLTTGLMLAQLASALALVSLAAAHTPTSAAIIFWALMASQYMCEPGAYTLLMDNVPAPQRSSASALTFFITAIVQAAASAGAGLAIDRLGYPTVLRFIAVLAIGAAVLFRSLGHPHPVADPLPPAEEHDSA